MILAFVVIFRTKSELRKELESNASRRLWTSALQHQQSSSASIANEHLRFTPKTCATPIARVIPLKEGDLLCVLNRCRAQRVYLR
jgi:5-formyltetrahydrofolate cyclo-ligase